MINTTTKEEKMSPEQIKNEKAAYEFLNKQMDQTEDKIIIAQGCNDFEAIEKYEKRWDSLQEKLNKLINCACQSFKISPDQYFVTLGF